MSGSSGARQLGHLPIRPFWAQLAVGFALHFGHLPVVPSGSSARSSSQSGHLPLVFAGHFGGLTLTHSGHLPTVPLGQPGLICGPVQPEGFFWGEVHLPPDELLCGPVLCPAGITSDGRFAPCGAIGAAAVADAATRPHRKSANAHHDLTAPAARTSPPPTDAEPRSRPCGPLLRCPADAGDRARRAARRSPPHRAA